MSPGVARDLVFVSYSHANPDWRDKMLVLLKPFVRQGQLQVWADPYIRSGDVGTAPSTRRWLARAWASCC